MHLFTTAQYSEFNTVFQNEKKRRRWTGKAVVKIEMLHLRRSLEFVVAQLIVKDDI
jgi:hypothetical protein